MKHTFTFLLLLFGASLQAQPGTIDKTYGDAEIGTVIAPDSKSTALSSAVQQDGKLLIGGYSENNGTYYLSLIRYDKNGSLDTLFGNRGTSLVSLNDLVKEPFLVQGIIGISIKDDGRIIATGRVDQYLSTEGSNIVLAQFLPDGTPDESFGSHGRVITDLGYYEVPSAIAVQADGKIVVSGYQIIIDYINDYPYLLLLRYNADGSPDKSFGNGSSYVKSTRAGTGARALLIQPDGKLVVGGYENSSRYFLLARYLPDGTPDASFGKNGEVTTALVDKESANLQSLALDSRGRLVAGGVPGTVGEGIIVARYLPDGSLDNSFDGDGQLRLTFNGVPYEYAEGGKVLVQPDDKVVVSSYLYTGQRNPVLKPVLNGLNEDGSLDASFGNNNGQTVYNTGQVNTAFSSLAMQPDGKIIVAENNYNDAENTNTYILTRFNGYPQRVPLLVRLKRWLQNHTLSWKGLPAGDKIAYYTVEQSPNGTSGFAPVAKVSGAANLTEYSITNSHLLQGSNYYRIKAVSTDGVIRYSEVVSADNTANAASVYPNPAKSYVTVQGLPNNETANISIKDGSGNVLARGVSTSSAQYRSSLGNNMQPGTYYLNITTGSKTEVLKFVKE